MHLRVTVNACVLAHSAMTHRVGTRRTSRCRSPTTAVPGPTWTLEPGRPSAAGSSSAYNFATPRRWLPAGHHLLNSGDGLIRLAEAGHQRQLGHTAAGHPTPRSPPAGTSPIALPQHLGRRPASPAGTRSLRCSGAAEGSLYGRACAIERVVRRAAPNISLSGPKPMNSRHRALPRVHQRVSADLPRAAYSRPARLPTGRTSAVCPGRLHWLSR